MSYVNESDLLYLISSYLILVWGQSEEPRAIGA